MPAADVSNRGEPPRLPVVTILVLGWAAAAVVGVLVWQAMAEHGVPDPTTRGLNPAAVVLSSAVLVFREGLEAILVLAAVTAGLARGGQGHERGVAVGSGLALLATVATWFLVVAIISEVDASELHIQAATGLLAIVVLLVVMNWFFHKIYWTGWIAHHDKRRRRLLGAPDATDSGRFWGLALLGFTAIYREGFEVVLFLQNLRLKAGTSIVLGGTAIGLALTVIVAALTFIAHRHLPYKRMLILTGILLAGVLVVMVGESAQEMQQAGWLTTTPMKLALPEWLGVWFAIFPTVESLAAQALAVGLVMGSYLSAQYVRRRGSRLAAPRSD
jgi:high-affinity iron transporter